MAVYKKRFKGWLLYLAALLAALALLVLFTPTLLSTPSGKKLLLKAITPSDAHLDIETLSLSWLGPQKMENVRFSAPGQTFSLESFYTDTSLFDCLTAKWKKTTLIEPKLKISPPKETIKEALPCKKTSKTSHKKKKIKKSSHRGFFLPATGTIEVKKGTVELDLADLPQVIFDDLQLTLQASSPEILISASMNTRQEKSLGKIAIDGKISPKLDSFQLKANVQDLPVIGVEELIAFFNPKCKGLTDFLGDTLNMRLDLHCCNEEIGFFLSAKSPLMSAEIAADSQNGSIGLSRPGEISFILPPHLFPLKEAAKGSIIIEQCSLPLLEKGFDWKKAALQATLQLSSATLSEPEIPFQNTLVQISSANLFEALEINASSDVLYESEKASLLGACKIFSFGESIEGELSLLNEKMQVDTTLSLKGNTLLAKGRGLLADHPLARFLGKTIDFDVASGRAFKKAFALKLQSELLLFDLQGALGENTLHIKKGSSLDFNASHLAKTLFPSLPISLEENEKGRLHFDSSFIPLSTSRLDTLELKGECTLPKLSLHHNISLQQTKALIRLDGKKEMVFANFHTVARKDQDKYAGTFSGDAAIDHLPFQKDTSLSPASIVLNLSAQDVNTSFVQEFFDLKEPLELAIGPNFNLHAELRSHEKEQTLFIKGDSRELQFNLPLTIKEKIELKGVPAHLKWTLTKDAYGILDRLFTSASKEERPFQLSQPGTIELSLSSLSIPLKSLKDHIPKPDFNPANMAFDLKASIDRLGFLEKRSQEKAGINKLILSAQKKLGTSPLEYRLKGEVFSSHEENGLVSITGHLDHLFDSQGKVDSNLTTQLNATISHFPTLLLDIFYRIFRNDILFTPVLGHKVDAELTAEIRNFSGPLSLKIDSAAVQTKIQGKLSQGILTLDEPLLAQMTITPALSSYLLKDLNPLSISAISAAKPLALRIDPKGFSIPIKNFDLTQMVIRQGTVDLGRIVCENDGTLGTIVGLLKLRGKEKRVPLWFAPIVFRVQQGIVQCERTEILVADAYDIATWGQINLGKDRVDMTLGLTAQTLRDAFGINDLPTSYVLQIPMKGKTGKVDINTTKATAKIAALITREQSKGKKGGVGILGEVLGMIGQLDDNQSSVPPAKHPFPWEKP